VLAKVMLRPGLLGPFIEADADADADADDVGVRGDSKGRGRSEGRGEGRGASCEGSCKEEEVGTYVDDGRKSGGGNGCCVCACV
jgi:hypothetical protein